MTAKTRIFVAGHKGMVGSALVRQLQKDTANEIITVDRQDCDLSNQAQVEAWFQQNPVDQVYLAAARVGGIQANNSYPAEFIYQNLMIQANVVHAAWRHSVNRLLLLGSSCIYPKLAEQPMAENALLTGTLEPTNEPYAIAKIAGIKICESYNRQYGCDFRSVMPTNLYGTGDNFHPENSHVIPALLRRFHEAVQSDAAEVVVWGSGSPRREFLHVDDMARGCVHIMGISKETYQAHTEPMLSHLNIGTGEDCTIRELVDIIAQTTGFRGEIRFDSSKPDGTPRKLLDVSRLKTLGWAAEINLDAGLKQTYDWYLQNHAHARSK